MTRGQGQGGQGGRGGFPGGKGRGQGPYVTRFPSDQGRQGPQGQPPRFPSDSNLRGEEVVPSFLRRDEGPRGGQDDRRWPRDEGRSEARGPRRDSWQDRPRDERPRDDRPRDDRPRDDRRDERPRDDRPRDDRPRDDRPQDDRFERGPRSRDDRPRDDRPRDERPRDDRPRDDRFERGPRSRDDRPRDDRPRDERPRDDRPRDERPRDDRRDDRRPFRAEGRGPQPGQGEPRGGREPQRGPSRGPGKLDPFELFCAYHLGITAEDGYRQTNLHEVARRFGVAPGVIKQSLQDHGMDPDTMLNSDFDLAMAQVDIQVSPPGVSKRELAKNIFEEFLQSKRGGRDWQRLLAEDAAVNAETYGRK